MKQCTICHISKPLDAFSNDKKGLLGRSAQCKECRYECKRNKYKVDTISRSKEREQQRLYYQKNQEAIRANVQLYRILKSVKISEYQKAYRSNPDNIRKANERSRKYRANPNNKAVLAHRQMQYAYKKYNAKGFSTKQQLKWRWDYYGGMCWVCTQQAKEFDHVIPLTKGGTNWPANLRPICRSCNARKSNIWPYNPKLAKELQ